MMRFMASLETRLNPGMIDIGDIFVYPLFPEWATLSCRWAKPTAVHAIRPHYTHLRIENIPLVPGFNRVFRKAVKRI